MTTDLSRLLAAAADDATAQRPALPAGPVLARIRRTRAVRRASSASGGLLVAGAVVVGGLQLADPREAPPAWTAPGPGDVVCGDPAAAWLEHVAEQDDALPRVTLEGTLRAASGGDLTVTARIGYHDVAVMGLPESEAPQVVLLHDGVVVGLSDGAPARLPVVEGVSRAGGPVPPGEGSSITFPERTVAAVSCATGEPLEPGAYDVLVVRTYRAALADVPPDVAPTAEEVARDGEPLTLVGGPWTLEVTSGPS